MSDDQDDKDDKTKETKDPGPAQDLLAALNPEQRARLLFVYKVVITAALLGVVAVTHRYGLGPGLVAAALYTLVF